MLQHADICRPQDISSLFLTLATLNYPSTRLEAIRAKLVTALGESDFAKSHDWLSHVWALVVLDVAEPQHIASVLRGEFLEKLASERDLSPVTKLKLLNIDAATAVQTTAYVGDRLPADSKVFAVPLKHAKNKVVLVDGMLDALKSLLASEAYVRTNVNTKMGFVIGEWVWTKTKNGHSFTELFCRCRVRAGCQE